MPKVTKKIKVDSVVEIVSGHHRGKKVKIKGFNRSLSKVFLEGVYYKVDVFSGSNGGKSFQSEKMIPIDISNVRIV